MEMPLMRKDIRYNLMSLQNRLKANNKSLISMAEQVAKEKMFVVSIRSKLSPNWCQPFLVPYNYEL
jgi:hypothetical protein